MRWSPVLASMGVVLALVAGLAPLAAAEDRETVLQTSSPFPYLNRGDRIRVRTRSEDPFQARFAAASRDTLFFAFDERLRDERRLAFTAIEGLDRRDGSRGHLLTGAILGLVGGAAIGALIGVYEGRHDTEPELITFVCAIGGAAGGLVVGSVVGVCIRSDRWSPVYEP